MCFQWPLSINVHLEQDHNKMIIPNNEIMFVNLFSGFPRCIISQNSAYNILWWMKNSNNDKKKIKTAMAKAIITHFYSMEYDIDECELGKTLFPL